MMNVWSKLLTALRGGANEVGEALVDGQGWLHVSTQALIKGWQYELSAK